MKTNLRPTYSKSHPQIIKNDNCWPQHSWHRPGCITWHAGFLRWCQNQGYTSLNSLGYKLDLTYPWKWTTPARSQGMQCSSSKALVSNVQKAYAMSAILLWRCLAEANEIFDFYGCHVYDKCTTVIVYVHSSCRAVDSTGEVSWDAWPRYENSRFIVQVGPDAFRSSWASAKLEIYDCWQSIFIRQVWLVLHADSTPSCIQDILPSTHSFCCPGQDSLWSTYMQCYHCFTKLSSLDMYSVLWLMT